MRWLRRLAVSILVSLAAGCVTAPPPPAELPETLTLNTQPGAVWELRSSYPQALCWQSAEHGAELCFIDRWLPIAGKRIFRCTLRRRGKAEPGTWWHRDEQFYLCLPTIHRPYDR